MSRKRLPGKVVCTHYWRNRAGIRTRVCRKSPISEPSDVIGMEIIPARGRGKATLHWLNVVDANAIVHCLSVAMAHALAQGTPVEPAE